MIQATHKEVKRWNATYIIKRNFACEGVYLKVDLKSPLHKHLMEGKAYYETTFELFVNYTKTRMTDDQIVEQGGRFYEILEATYEAGRNDKIKEFKQVLEEGC